jgi:hypothetical protein
MQWCWPGASLLFFLPGKKVSLVFWQSSGGFFWHGNQFLVLKK